MLTANYTFVNERLAKHYGIPNILGNRFRARDAHRSEPLRAAGTGQHFDADVDCDPDFAGAARQVGDGGNPGNAAASSAAERTGAPGGRPTEPSNCRCGKSWSSIARIEPCAAATSSWIRSGFSLENFDAVGAWRTHDGAFRVDTAGKMFDGTKVNGPASLRQALLKHSDVFIRTFTQSLLAYGLGRVIDYRDMPFVREIEREAAKNDNHFSSFVMGVVKSVPFQMRRAEENEPAPTTVADRWKSNR